MMHISEQMTHPKYRPDIDGLRGIAVLSVVGFHAASVKLAGGFIGVDIFFVISGFLISTIIFKSLAHNSFSFIEFYSRRIRRIFPALFLVLISSFVFGWVALRADEYKQLGKHIAGGAGFLSNFVLLGESGYFDFHSAKKPLLHLWSLGIEEQFYIIWPLFLWLAWRQRNGLFTMLLAVFALSFALNIEQIGYDPIATFYSPQTRFWELLLGSSLAYIVLYKKEMFSFLAPVHFNLCSFFGASLIVIGLFTITKEGEFPGWLALMPTFGSALVIFSGPQAWLNRVVLSNRVLVWFGLISFPLYLWHWPIMSFGNILSNMEQLQELSRGNRVIAIIVSIVLSWLTYKLVEKPIRFGDHSKLKTLILLTSMIFTGYAGYICFQYDGFESRIPKDHKKYYSIPYNQNYVPDYTNQGNFFSNITPIKGRDFFLFKAKSVGETEIAIVGDSHANRLYYGVIEFTKRSVLNIGRGTCPPFLDVEVHQGNKSFTCQPLMNQILTELRDSKHIKVIVINAFFVQYIREMTLKEGETEVDLTNMLTKTLRYLLNSNKIVVLVLDVPEISSACYITKFPIWSPATDKEKLYSECTTDYRVQREQNDKIIDALKKGGIYNDLKIFDTSEFLCYAQRCGEIDNNNFLYVSDGNHLNEFGIRKIGRPLADYLAHF